MVNMGYLSETFVVVKKSGNGKGNVRLLSKMLECIYTCPKMLYAISS